MPVRQLARNVRVQHAAVPSSYVVTPQDEESAGCASGARKGLLRRAKSALRPPWGTKPPSLARGRMHKIAEVNAEAMGKRGSEQRAFNFEGQEDLKREKDSTEYISFNKI